jgi:hypothetical protein
VSPINVHDYSIPNRRTKIVIAEEFCGIEDSDILSTTSGLSNRIHYACALIIEILPFQGTKSFIVTVQM